MPRWTKEDLSDYEHRANTRWRAEQAKLPDANRQAQAPQSERPVRHESLAAQEGKAGNAGRFSVRIEGRRARLLDPDNLCAKYFLDCCRYSGLIPDDRAQDIEYSVIQTKVKTRAEEETVITITKL